MFSASNTKSSRVFLIAVCLMVFIANPVCPIWGAAQSSGAQAEALEYPRTINVNLAKEKKENGAFFLDVRETYEWAQVRIPESVLIPLNQLKDRLDEIPEDRDIVVVCQSGSRSARALDFIRKAGFLKSSSMQGGIQLWQQVGYPVEKGS
jgi:rhodanese-related sulfurtransferase